MHEAQADARRKRSARRDCICNPLSFRLLLLFFGVWLLRPFWFAKCHERMRCSTAAFWSFMPLSPRSPLLAKKAEERVATEHTHTHTQRAALFDGLAPRCLRPACSSATEHVPLSSPLLTSLARSIHTAPRPAPPCPWSLDARTAFTQPIRRASCLSIRSRLARRFPSQSHYIVIGTHHPSCLHQSLPSSPVAFVTLPSFSLLPARTCLLESLLIPTTRYQAPTSSR